MAAGDVLLDPDGNVILDDDGNVMLSDGAGDDCCCGCPDCDFCVGLGQTTPCRMLLTLSGVTLCPGCNADGAAAGQWTSWDAGADFDGSYCLTQAPGSGPGIPCGYGGTITGPTLNIYSDAACTTLVRSISTWKVEIGPLGPPIGFNCFLYNDSDPDGRRDIVHAPAFVTADCVATMTANPTGAACGTGLGNAAGTWTVTPGGC
jgi:hypothetical protein